MNAVEALRPYASHAAQQRGWEYVDRVVFVEGDAQAVQAEVEGTYIYDVSIALDGHTLRVSCSCPHFSDSGHVCKHLWATAAAAAERHWLAALPADVRLVIGFNDLEDHSVARAPAPAAGSAATAATADQSGAHLHPRGVPRRESRPATWVSALDAVTADARPQNQQAWAGAELVYIISASPRATVSELPLTVERRERKRDGNWSKPQPARLTRSEIAHLPDGEDRWALSMMNAASSFPHDAGAYGYGWGSQPFGTVYLQSALVDMLLPRLCTTGRVYLRTTQANVAPRARSDTDVTLLWDGSAPWQLRLLVSRNEEAITYRVDAVLERGDERESVHRFALITDSIAVLDNVASPFDPAGGFRWARELRARGAFEIPAKSRAMLVESVITSGVSRVDLPEELRWEERAVAPRFHLRIDSPTAWDSCAVHPAVEYQSVLVPFDGAARAVSEEGHVVYRRDLAAERDALALLKRYGVSGPISGALVAVRKVPALVQALVSRGWQVEAEGARYRTLPAPKVHIKSGIDWFELAASDETGASLDFPALLKALKEGKRTITLGDGTIGMLPEEWLARVAPLLSIGEGTATGVRFKLPQVALIDALLATQPAVDWDEGFTRARAAIRTFEGVHGEDPPPTFHGVLREYQREALGWMRFLRTFGFGGCLADDMGLGKTVMVLAMLEARRVDEARPHRPSLVVLPRSLLFNWTSEAQRFTPALRLLDYAHAARHEAAGAIAHADLVLTTYGTLRRDVAALKDVPFDYVILDEAQAIKNANTATSKAVRLLRADHRLALTGTPVENHIGELHSLFDFLNPGLLGRGGLFDVRKLSAAETTEHVARLARGLRPFFLRRTKEHVAPELPPRTEETLFCELEGAQRKTYLELRDHYRRSLLKAVDNQGLAKSRFQILEALLRLRQAACHVGLLHRGEHAARVPRHGNGTASESSAKFALLLPRLDELREEGRKALVFSQFTSLLALLREQLDASGVTYEYLDGQTVDRAQRVARFQEDASCRLFLISLKAGGVGLNLTAAEYVFLLDPWWNPAVEAQAIDRTHRIGQTQPVFAYRLVARDTVEERILELQSRKRELADAILEAGAGGLRGLQREDLEALLS